MDWIEEIKKDVRSWSIKCARCGQVLKRHDIATIMTILVGPHCCSNLEEMYEADQKEYKSDQ
jgi:hypothetical protein